MLKTSMNNIDALLSAIAESTNLYLPVSTGTEVRYDKWKSGDTADIGSGEQVNYHKYSADKVVRLDAISTIGTPKDMFFPQSEDLASFRRNGKEITVEAVAPEVEEFAVIGVRPCDARSIEILDMVFLSDPVDNFYKARREHGTLITLACDMPLETCFCTAFGIDATGLSGDVTIYMDNGYLYWQAVTPKGEKLEKQVSSFFEPAEESELNAFKQRTKDYLSKLLYGKVSTKKIAEKTLKELFDSDKWRELSSACLGCGTCTFVCPTCQCYDIEDFDAGDEVRRFRCWDSCMYSDFTQMAHGNPRTSQIERFRQRFMHKLSYFPANNDGVFACVGCGRCVAKCPISMNIVKVINALGED